VWLGNHAPANLHSQEPNPQGPISPEKYKTQAVNALAIDLPFDRNPRRKTGAAKHVRMTPATQNTPAIGQLQLGEFLLAAKTPPPPQSQTPVTVTAAPTQPKETPPPGPAKPSITTLPREEILEQIFQSNCGSWRRWGKELLFGATDEELSRSMGNSYGFGDEINTHFQTNSEPALTVTYRVFDVPLTTASFAEVAQYVRRIAKIPERKSPEECARLLEEKLNEIRTERRAEIAAYVRSLTGEKFRETTRRKKTKKKAEPETDDRPLSTTEQIVSLLFAPDCMTEASDRRLLIQITRLLHRKANVEILKAAEGAVAIVKRAKSDWSCYTAYWTDHFQPRESACKQGKETTEGSEPAPP
jgi:hypothetical protein